jgi:hypothetical protein
VKNNNMYRVKKNEMKTRERVSEIDKVYMCVVIQGKVSSKK